MSSPKTPPDLAAVFLCVLLTLFAAACAAPRPVPVGAPSPVPPAPPPPAPAAPPKPTPPPKPAPESKPAPALRRPSPPPPRAEVAPPPEGGVVARDNEYVILVAGPGDTLRSLAETFLGSAERDWVIADFNGVDRLSPGQEIVVPLGEPNPVGVYAEGYQTVPILCYHRFGEKRAKMVVTPEAFAEQMAYLANNGYRVVRLPDLVAFLEGRRALPRKAVAVTIDDGYRSSYRVAYPILRKHGLPATIFVYTDFIGAGDGLTWDQLSEMAASGLIDLQPHSRTHGNLALRTPKETPEAYAERVRAEVVAPRDLLGGRLGIPIHTYAYPYGDANDLVAEQVRRAGYRLGATVLAGGNGFFSPPYLLRRTMVFGEDDLEAFKAKLEVFRGLGGP